MTIKEAQIESNRIATEKGFWEKYDNIPERAIDFLDGSEIDWVKEQHIITKIALIGTELSEAIEASRKGKFAPKVGGNDKLLHLPIEGRVSATPFILDIKDTFEDELADAAIRLFDLTEKLGVDLTWHIQQKLIYNESRPKLHGKTC